VPPNPPTPPDPLVRLPAERRRRKDEGIVLYACCSCCCCLHTIGGLIGAACAGNHRGTTRGETENEQTGTEPDWNGFDDRPRVLPGAQALFWSSLAIVVLLQVVIAGVRHSTDLGGVLAWSLAAVIMLGPAYLLAACVVMAIRIGLSPTLRKDPGYFRSTLKVFGAAFLGTIAGTGAMFFLLILLSAGAR
jgi:hypothetical protein